MILAEGKAVRTQELVFLRMNRKVRIEMYDEVFSDLQWRYDLAAFETPSSEHEADSAAKPVEMDGRRLRVLTPRQRARLIEPVSILYLG